MAERVTMRGEHRPLLPTGRVVVPDVVVLADEARRAARAAGVVPAQPDPDEPPLAELTWGVAEPGRQRRAGAMPPRASTAERSRRCRRPPRIAREP